VTDGAARTLRNPRPARDSGLRFRRPHGGQLWTLVLDLDADAVGSTRDPHRHRVTDVHYRVRDEFRRQQFGDVAEAVKLPRLEGGTEKSSNKLWRSLRRWELRFEALHILTLPSCVWRTCPAAGGWKLAGRD